MFDIGLHHLCCTVESINRVLIYFDHKDYDTSFYHMQVWIQLNEKDEKNHEFYVDNYQLEKFIKELKEERNDVEIKYLKKSEYEKQKDESNVIKIDKPEKLEIIYE